MSMRNLCMRIYDQRTNFRSVKNNCLSAFEQTTEWHKKWAYNGAIVLARDSDDDNNYSH